MIVLRAFRLALFFLVLACTPVAAGPLQLYEYGPQQGALPLVLVHGWACDATFWELQTGPLSQTRPVLVVELPGHGSTPAAVAPCSLEAMARAIGETLEAAGVQRAVLAGHSMGAAVIRWYAHLFPERTAGLVLLDGALMPYPETPEEREFWQQHVAGMYERMAAGDDSFTASFIDAMHGAETPEELKTRVREAMLSTPREVRLECMRLFVDPEVWNLPPVPAPTLAIFVASPDLPPDYERGIRSMFPNVDYRLWDGPGHFLQMERPKEVNEAMEAFVESLE